MFSPHSWSVYRLYSHSNRNVAEYTAEWQEAAIKMDVFLCIIYQGHLSAYLPAKNRKQNSPYANTSEMERMQKNTKYVKNGKQN